MHVMHVRADGASSAFLAAASTTDPCFRPAAAATSSAPAPARTTCADQRIMRRRAHCSTAQHKALQWWLAAR